MTVRVAVDFGTTSTCVVASVNGREPQVVVIDGQPLMSSAVFAAADGTLFVGQEAERQAAVDPSRYEPNPKRRIDEGELLLGDSVLRVTDVIHAVLGRAVAEARRIAGDAEVNLLVLTHPADWGAIRTRLLRQAAGRLAREVALVPEPVAAAVYHAATFAPVASPDGRTVEFSGRPGDALAVLDLGGGTVDVSVVQRLPDAGRGPGGRPQRGGFQVLATRGDPSFGGADIDQALLDHVGSLVSDADPDAWQQLVTGRELADRRRRRVLRQDVRGAKETLSRHTYTDVPMPPPFADAHVTREDLEKLIAAPLGRTVELTSAAIAEAGLRPKQLTAIFLVGGSSRIPMISRLVHERTGVVPTSLDQPETVVARGALRAVLVDADRTGALPGSQAARGAGVPADQRTAVVHPGTVNPNTAHPNAGHPGDAQADSGRTELVARAVPPRAQPRPPHALNQPAPMVQPPSGPMPAARPTPGRGFAGAAGASPSGPGGPALGAPGGPNGPSGPGGPGGPGGLGGPAGQPWPTETGATGKSGRKRRLWAIGAIVAVIVVVAAVVLYVVNQGSDDPAAAQQGRTFVQYDFSVIAPADWVQTSDQVAERQVILHPQDATAGNDLVVTQEFVMDYDATADRAQLVDSLRSQAARDPNYSAFNPDLTYGGRAVIGYHQRKSDQLTVNWFVVVQGKIRVHVGCQYEAPALRQRVDTACEQIVRTLKITS
ncbi:type VII secretion-associated protein [Amycolatopsis rhabdoformis]|uniref:Type VII secretion-associated protein n=1 Tax=Amycolatopsis rhabdoformis TaxID=1448059 RepID=A0ABZ1I683_9PSEU|nr:type VII secretion-associated protein [Amycolatopsis rhabdoformis]WSE29155.1 type VII secretion-associated protein [Amycolatopsis rhabdoformis]